MSVQTGEFADTMEYLELEVHLQGRRVPEVILIPVQHGNTVDFERGTECERSYRCRTRVTGKDRAVVENATPGCDLIINKNIAAGK